MINGSSVKLEVVDNLTSEVSEFFSENFDVEEYAHKITSKGDAVAEQLSFLKQQMTILDQQLKNQVGAHHTKLLTQATSIESLEDVLDTLRQHIQTLQSGTRRACGRISDLHQTEVRTMQLERLHETCNLLRATIRVIYLTSKLQSSLGGGSSTDAPGSNDQKQFAVKDIAKSAALLQELREITGEIDLTGLDVISRDLSLIPIWQKTMMTQARQLFAQGLRSRNQPSIGTALQAFYSLKCMTVEIDRQSDEWKAEITNSLDSLTKAAVDKSKKESSGNPGGAQIPKAPSSAMLRNALWINVERLCECIFLVYQQCDVLRLVLGKKRDHMTHQLFVEVYSDEKFNEFWKTLTTSVIQKRLDDMKGFVKHTLEDEYPKMLRYFTDSLKKMDQITDAELDDVFQTKIDRENNKKVQFLVGSEVRKALSPLENPYLHKSISKLYDVINMAFSDDNGCPGQNEISQMVQAIVGEMNFAVFDRSLFAKVCRNVAKAVKMFAVKSEQLISTDGEASQVVGTVTAGQKRNTDVINSLFLFRSELLKAMEKFDTSSLSEEVLSELAEALDDLLSMITNVLLPLLDSSLESCTAIIESMHREDFSGNGATKSMDNESRQCSLYMRELQEFIARIQQDYFVPIQCQELLLQHTTELARKTCDVFVTHAVLVKPLGESGRLQLAADFAQMELAITPLVVKVGDLGQTYQTLRSLRPLLFETAAEIVVAPTIGKSVPYSLVMHLLISMSEQELQSPHITAGWSISRYSKWLLEHRTETDRLQFLKGTLQAYAKNVQQSGKLEYVDMYPLLCDLLKKAVDSGQTVTE